MLMCIPTVRLSRRNGIQIEEVSIAPPVMIQIYYAYTQKCPKCGQQINTAKREYRHKQTKVLIDTKTGRIEKITKVKMLVFVCPKCGAQIYP